MSKVAIANECLTILSQTRKIASFDEENTAARSVSGVYDSVRRAEISAHPWNFALGRVQLSPLSGKTAYGDAYRYQKPVDYLRLAGQYPTYSDYEYDFQEEGQHFVSHMSPPIDFRYVKDVTNTDEMAPLFRSALAAALAIKLSLALTQSARNKRFAMEQYTIAITSAKKANAIATPAQQVAEAPWLEVRRPGEFIDDVRKNPRPIASLQLDRYGNIVAEHPAGSVGYSPPFTSNE